MRLHLLIFALLQCSCFFWFLKYDDNLFKIYFWGSFSVFVLFCFLQSLDATLFLKSTPKGVSFYSWGREFHYWGLWNWPCFWFHCLYCPEAVELSANYGNEILSSTLSFWTGLDCQAGFPPYVYISILSYLSSLIINLRHQLEPKSVDEASLTQLIL